MGRVFCHNLVKFQGVVSQPRSSTLGGRALTTEIVNRGGQRPRAGQHLSLSPRPPIAPIQGIK